MSKILVGGISPEAEVLLKSYIDKFLPDVVIEPLTSAGIRGRIRNHAGRPDVILVVIDQPLYDLCADVCKDVLSLPKVHLYKTDAGLRQFLIDKFGEDLGAEDIAESDNYSDIAEVAVDIESSSEFTYQVEDVSVGLESNEGKSESNAGVSVSSSELEEELHRKELIIHNLTLQLQDAKHENDAEIQSFVEHIRELETKLSLSDPTNIDVTAELESQIEDLKAELITVRAEYELTIADLEKTISELNIEISSLKVQISDLQESLDEKDTELLRLNMELDNSQSTIIDGTELEDAVDTLRAQCQQLTEELSSAKDSLAQMEQDNTSLRDELCAKATELDDARIDLETLRTGLANASSPDTSTQISVLTSSLEALKEENRTIGVELSYSKTEIEQLQGTIDSRDAEIQTLVAEKSALLDEKASLESRITEIEASAVGHDAELEQLKFNLSEVNQLLASSKTEVERLTNDNIELQSLVSQSLDKESTIRQLTSDLTVAKAENDSLQAELDTLRQSDSSSNSRITELRVDNAKLKSDLANSVPKADYDDIQSELTESRSKCASLELELVTKESKLTSLTSGIFGQMSGVVTPKLSYSISLSSVGNLGGGVHCVAGGSSESYSFVYQTLAKTVSAMPNKRFIILDLVSDSIIDREFGINNIKSPIDWLFGKASFTGYLANTRYGNAKVISTALAFINDLAFLHVDWQQKLAELAGMYDYLIINVGCLNNLVSRVLFNTFSGTMKTNVITKATPINLRTVYLTMTGFLPVSSNVVISCTNFDERHSKSMYEKLSQKFKTEILDSSGVLKL